MFEGINPQDVLTGTFEAALLGSVSDSVGVPTTAVTGVVLPNGSDRKGRRRALLSASCVCTASVISGMTSDKVLTKLNDAIANGTFLAFLRSRSGLNITSISSASITDATPQISSSVIPTAAPNGKPGTILYHTILFRNALSSSSILIPYSSSLDI
jgi:hypothetical protein